MYDDPTHETLASSQVKSSIHDDIPPRVEDIPTGASFLHDAVPSLS